MHIKMDGTHKFEYINRKTYFYGGTQCRLWTNGMNVKYCWKLNLILIGWTVCFFRFTFAVCVHICLFAVCVLVRAQCAFEWMSNLQSLSIPWKALTSYPKNVPPHKMGSWKISTDYWFLHVMPWWTALSGSLLLCKYLNATEATDHFYGLNDKIAF